MIMFYEEVDDGVFLVYLWVLFIFVSDNQTSWSLQESRNVGRRTFYEPSVIEGQRINSC